VFDALGEIILNGTNKDSICLNAGNYSAELITHKLNTLFNDASIIKKLNEAGLNTNNLLDTNEFNTV